MKLYLFQPDAAYSGGAVGVAANDLAEAQRLVAAREPWLIDLKHISEEYNDKLHKFVPLDAPHLVGVRVSGKPRILFDHTYTE
jgi:hypothetical protein